MTMLSSLETELSSLILPRGTELKNGFAQFPTCFHRKETTAQSTAVFFNSRETLSRRQTKIWRRLNLTSALF